MIPPISLFSSSVSVYLRLSLFFEKFQEETEKRRKGALERNWRWGGGQGETMATPVGWHNGCIPDAMEPRRIVAKSNNARNRYWLFHKNDLREAAFVLRKKSFDR